MLISHGNYEWNVRMDKVSSVEWTVSKTPMRSTLSDSESRFYWNVYIQYESPAGTPREFVLESGILDDKVSAFTQARKRARHFRRERYNEIEATKAPIIPNMKGWK
jgi:hypothetical protein